MLVEHKLQDRGEQSSVDHVVHNAERVRDHSVPMHEAFQSRARREIKVGLAVHAGADQTVQVAVVGAQQSQHLSTARHKQPEHTLRITPRRQEVGQITHVGDETEDKGVEVALGVVERLCGQWDLRKNVGGN